MGNRESIIKTDKYKFTYLPSFLLYLNSQLYLGDVKASSTCTQSAAHLLDNLHYAEKASQARNRPKGCVAKGPH